jgi:hypothetical protein
MSHDQKNKKTIVILSVLVCLIMLFITCKKIMPEFEEETYTMGALADRACEYLSMDTTGADYLKIDAMLMEDLVDSALLANTHNNHDQIIPGSFNQIIQAVDNIITEKLLIINYPGSGDTTYIAYKHELAQKNITFFVSWDFNASNEDSYIDIEIIKSNGNTVDKISAVPMETVSGCIDTLIYINEDTGEESGRKILPKIRTYFQCSLENESYLIRIINSEPAALGSSLMVMLP